MRTRREKANDRRILAGAGFLFAVFVTMLFTACASVPRHDPLYDGGTVAVGFHADSATFFPLHIENHRTKDGNPPSFILNGFGRHDLGIVGGMGGMITRLIDTAWLDADHCMTITAHYIGGRDLVFDRTCWREGEKVGVSLDNIFTSGASWSRP